MKYTFNLDEVKKINSEAQLIAQNKPETMEKRNTAVKLAFKYNGHKIKLKHQNSIQKFYNSSLGKIRKKEQSERSKNYWKNKDYREKCTNTKCLSGNYDGISFDSSYELSLILYYKDKIYRSNLHIPYKVNNEIHYYYPDFVLNTNEGKIIIEIKGQDSNIVRIKEKYARLFVRNSQDYIEYRMLFREDLKKLPGFIFYDSYKKIQQLDQSRLQIYQYPKSWKII